MRTLEILPRDWGLKLAAMLRYRGWKVTARIATGDRESRVIQTEASVGLCRLLIAKIELEGPGWNGGFKDPR